MKSSKVSWLSGWGQALSVFADKRALIMFFLGFSAGIPILLIFSSLSLWLGEAGIERKAVTFFSWAALGYSFKFVWAPLIDELPLPWLTRSLGRRRAWLLVAQLLIMTAISIMAMTDPSQGQASLVQMAIGAVLLGFSAATQDIVIDAYRIELAEAEMQSVLAATYNAGYRIAMIVAGAGALFLASGFGSEKGSYVYQAWQSTYLIMAAVMLVGVLTTLIIREPARQRPVRPYQPGDYARLVMVFMFAVAAFVYGFIQVGQFWQLASDVGPLIIFLHEFVRIAVAIAIAGLTGYLLVKAGAVNQHIAVETWVAPIRDFFERYGAKTALLLLLLIGLYRISDIVAGVISNVFYQDMGFSKDEIATAVKVFGVVFSLAGGFLGGMLSQRFSVLKILMLGAILSSATNLIFIGFSQAGHSLPWLYFAIVADNLASGLAGAAFIAFLSSLTSVSFTAVQYAIFSSLMTLIPKVIGGYSGTIVDSAGYPYFFLFTTLIGVPVLVLIVLVQRQLGRHHSS
ncbi:AmpG family muropeptide MFS transporter [Alkanindiges sp. WGS2144]|uniref:AmpG family muropeptide MFS transporter n=1 Tax=Alkanindiges sp. WGS2144 TaxID=3366808 RepID=UPI003753391B